jgi:hypothetical protein
VRFRTSRLIAPIGFDSSYRPRISVQVNRRC